MKKKGIILISAFSIILLISLFFYVKQNYVKKDDLTEIIKIAAENKEEYDIQEYDKNINVLKKEGQLKTISSVYVTTLKDDATNIIYIGRNNCPYCQDFLPEITTVLEENSISIKYLDTNIEKAEHPEELKKIIEKYDIQGVPTLLKIEGNQYEEYGTKETDLQAFLQN